jgi:hypothetical protein
MRDEKDPGTLEMPLPRKRGRPCKFEGMGPMTPATRAFLYRQRRRNDFSDSKDKSDASLIDSIKRTMRWVAERSDADAQDVLDMYIEEFVKRHHSSGFDLYPHRKP